MSDNKIVIDSSDVDKARVSLKSLSEELGVTGNVASQAEGQINKMAQALKAANANPFVAGFVLLAAALGGAAIAAKGMFSDFTEGAASLNNLSKQTGISVEQLSIMKTVAAQSGTSMETVTNAVLKFEKALAAGGKETSVQSRAFKELGINTSDTSKTTEQYMTMAAQKLEGLRDGWQKNNIVMALFGKTGTEVNEFLSDYANKGDIAAKVTSDQAQMAEDYERSMRKLSVTTNQYKNLIGSALLPVASALVDEFVAMTSGVNKLDQSSKDLIKNTVADWAFNIAKGLGAAIDVGIAFWNILKGLGQAVGAFAGALVTSGDIMNKILHGDFTGAWNLYKTNAVELGKSLVGAFNTASQASSTFYDAATRAEAKYRAELGKTKAAKTDTRPNPNNIGDGDTKAPKTPDLDNELRALEKKLLLQGQLYEADALRILIDKGYYDKYDKEQVKQLQGLQQEIDLQVRKNTVKNVDKEVAQKMQEAEASRIATQVLTQYGKTNNDVAIAVQAYRITLAETELQTARNSGATRKEIDTLEDKIRVMKAEQEANRQRKTDGDAEIARQRSFSAGWEQSFNKYKDDASNAAKTAETLFNTASKGMEDAFVQFATTGKLSFSSLANSIIADLARIAAKKAVAGIFDFFASAFSANGNTFSSGGTILKSANGNVFDQPTLHGYSGGIGMIGEAGPEAVLPLKRNAAGQLGVVSQGGAGAQQNVIQISVTVQGGNTNDQTGSVVASKVAEQFTRGIVRQELANARRVGGVLNPV